MWLPLAAGLFAVCVAFLSGPGSRDTLRWIGFALALIGLAGVILARYTLGRSFSISPKAKGLVTRGIYSRIRNPIYVFSTILVAGIFLMIRNPYLWLILGALVCIQSIRARREARVLEAAFGEAYREYRKRTWF